MSQGGPETKRGNAKKKFSVSNAVSNIINSQILKPDTKESSPTKNFPEDKAF